MTNPENSFENSLVAQQMDLLFIWTCGAKKIPIDYQDHSESAVRINGGYKCGECRRTYKREPRVEALMKCGKCSYGLTCANGHKI